jgi:hypothetical protein
MLNVRVWVLIFEKLIEVVDTVKLGGTYPLCITSTTLSANSDGLKVTLPFRDDVFELAFTPTMTVPLLEPEFLETVIQSSLPATVQFVLEVILSVVSEGFAVKLMLPELGDIEKNGWLACVTINFTISDEPALKLISTFLSVEPLLLSLGFTTSTFPFFVHVNHEFEAAVNSQPVVAEVVTSTFFSDVSFQLKASEVALSVSVCLADCVTTITTGVVLPAETVIIPVLGALVSE